jgi:hypothetical protein
MGVEQLADSGLLRKAPCFHGSWFNEPMGRRQGGFSRKGSSCRLFLTGTDGETNVACLAAVRGSDILDHVVAEVLTLALVGDVMMGMSRRKAVRLGRWGQGGCPSVPYA